MGFSWDFGQIPSPVQVIGPETVRLGSLREELTGPEENWRSAFSRSGQIVLDGTRNFMGIVHIYIHVYMIELYK